MNLYTPSTVKVCLALELDTKLEINVLTEISPMLYSECTLGLSVHAHEVYRHVL